MGSRNDKKESREMGRKILVGLAVAGLVVFGWSQMSVAATSSSFCK